MAERDSTHTEIPKRRLGKTDEMVSILCLGGFHIGIPDETTGVRLIHESLDAGVNFLDNAWEYNGGLSEERMGRALAQDGYRAKAFVMTKNCAHDRLADHSMEKLEDSLRRLQTDYLDLWQVHEVAWDDDPDRILAPGGAAEAMVKAKEQGKVRYIGFTGHKHPDLHRKLLTSGVPWDTVQLPLNVLDYHYASFEREILPLCEQLDVGVIGMKSLASAHLLKSGAPISPVEARRYALSLPAASICVGIDTLEILEQDLGIARGFVPYTPEELDELRERARPFVADGRWEPFKTTRDYEGDEGRKVHDYPLKAAD